MTPQELLQAGPQAGGPQAILQGAAQGPPGGPAQGMNPGGIEALRNGVRFLMQFMTPEEILDALLKLAQEKGMDIPEDQLRQIIENETASPQGSPAAPSAGAPPAGAPPTLQ